MPITYDIKQSKLIAFVPYELKDFFRSHFPSAVWNASWKKWELADSAGKRAKLDAMIKDLATDPSYYQAALATKRKGRAEREFELPMSVWDDLDFLEDNDPAAAQRLRNRMEYHSHH